MKIVSLIVVLILILSLTLTACQTESSPQNKLSFAYAILSINDNGKWKPAGSSTFNKGDSIGIVFINVSGFKKDEEGLNHMDIDVEVTNSEGEIVLFQEGILGENGRTNMDNNTAGTPVGSVRTEEFDKGTYSLKVTIYDRVGGGEVVDTKSFTLE